MPRRRTWLIVILILALVFRLVAAAAVQQKVGGRLCLIAGDANGYWLLAKQIASGGDFSLYEPPRQIHRMPGFPAVWALSMQLFGDNRLAIRCLLAIVGTAACGAVYLLGRRLFDENIALVACALSAVSPVMIGFSVLLLSETLFALTLVLSLWCAANWLSEKRNDATASQTTRWSSAIWALLTGVSIAIATYVRPSWLLAGFMLAVVVVARGRCGRRQLFESAVMLIGLLGTMLPWAARNHEVCGHWVFTTLWSGPSLYDGLSPEATGESNMDFFDRDNLMSKMSEWDVDRHYSAAAWQFARHRPMRAIELTFIKLWRYWKPWPNAEQFGGVGPALLVALFFVPLMVLAFRGACQSQHRPWVWVLTAGPILYFAAIHSLFVGSLRYRLPAEYPLCVLAAVGIVSLSRNLTLSRYLARSSPDRVTA